MRLPRVRFTIRRMMIAVAAVAVLIAAGMYLGPDLALIVGVFAFIELVLARWISRDQGFGTGGTLVIAAAALFWTLQYVWWRNFAAVTVSITLFCMVALPVWYLPVGESMRLLILQMILGVVTLMAAKAVIFVLVFTFLPLFGRLLTLF
jgi:hypothetical protein